MNLVALRPHAGVRLKLAKEFTGYADTDKKFREIARGIPGAFLPPPDYDPNAHKIYTAAELRRIKQWLLPDLPLALDAMPALITFRMSKGGTGKTTIGANVAACLALHGYRVLVIDADSQGSISELLGFDINLPLTHIGNLLERVSRRESTRIREAVVPVYAGGMLDLIPADISLSNDMWMMAATGREFLLERLMKEEADFFKQYDAVVIDCAPGTSLLTTAMMTGSKILTSIVKPEPQSVRALEGLALHMDDIYETMKLSGRPRLGLHVVLNGFNQSVQMHNESLREIDAKWGRNLDDTIVPTYAGFLREMALKDVKDSAPLIEKEPNSIGTRAIIEVTKSLIKLYGLTITAAGMPERTVEAEGVAA